MLMSPKACVSGIAKMVRGLTKADCLLCSLPMAAFMAIVSTV